MKKSDKRKGRGRQGQAAPMPAAVTGAGPRDETGGSKTAMPRRAMLGRVGYGVAGILLLGGAATWGIQHVQSIRSEHDLSRMGQGVPTVVQVHDPQCPICNELQTQTRRALSGYEDGEVLYLVANIQTAEGSAFAADHGASHVTLLLFDGTGDLRDTLTGPHRAGELRPSFARLAQGG